MRTLRTRIPSPGPFCLHSPILLFVGLRKISRSGSHSRCSTNYFPIVQLPFSLSSPSPLYGKVFPFFFIALSFIRMNDLSPQSPRGVVKSPQEMIIQHVVNSDIDLASNRMMNQKPKMRGALYFQ